MILMASTALASETPEYLKDGVVTVTLKNGKQHTFSANEYMVAKRGNKKKEISRSPQKEKAQDVVFTRQPKRLKHIISGEVLRSNSGLETSMRSNEVNVRSKKEIGVGLQYQYNFHGDLYMGGRVDTNGGTGLNLGVGF